MKVDFEPKEMFRGTRLLRHRQNLAYAYETTHTSIDADGAPNAYHPDDVGKNCTKDTHIGLDCPANAGYPKTKWWNSVLVVDPSNSKRPFRQPRGRYAGYFIAMTALRSPGGSPYEVGTYVDSREFSYVVIPTGFNKLRHVASQGDVGLATHLPTGKSVPFIVADYGGGTSAKLGEGSIALFEALGGVNLNARTGAGVPKGKIQYILFPNSKLTGTAIWPRTKSDIRKQVMELIKTTSGIERG